MIKDEWSMDLTKEEWSEIEKLNRDLCVRKLIKISELLYENGLLDEVICGEYDIKIGRTKEDLKKVLEEIHELWKEANHYLIRVNTAKKEANAPSVTEQP